MPRVTSSGVSQKRPLQSVENKGYRDAVLACYCAVNRKEMELDLGL